jgi:hypothetical protein
LAALSQASAQTTVEIRISSIKPPNRTKTALIPSALTSPHQADAHGGAGKR